MALEGEIRDQNTEAERPLPDIPSATVGRLILYARELQRLRREGQSHVSSGELGVLLSVSDAVVRRDVSYLGQMGRRGVGYEVAPLIHQIRETMGTNVKWKVALIGAGSLGTALIRYRGFSEQGFELVAAFDSDPARWSQSIAGVPILPSEDIESTVHKLDVQLAILAVPGEVAGSIAARLCKTGVAGILNFAPVPLQKDPNVCVVNVDLASELQQLSFAVVKQMRD